MNPGKDKVRSSAQINTSRIPNRAKSSLQTKVIAGVLFPLHEALKGHSTVSVLRDLDKSQWFQPAVLQALQEKLLAELLAHAAEYVPFYRDKISQDLINESGSGIITRFRRMPFLTKELVRRNCDELKSTGTTHLVSASTGGSTGEPLRFFLDRRRKSFDIAAKWRATRWWNVDIGDREVVFWGSPVELGTQDRVRAVRDFMFRSHLVPAFEMSQQNMRRFVSKIDAFKPRMLFGYPSSIDQIAAYANSAGYDLASSPLDVVFVTSECLYEHQRARISKTFGCRVANGYGGRESGFIAHECAHGGMHINSDFLIVEIVSAEGVVLGPGEEGEIVVTNLASHGFPIIRYRTGDIGVLANEMCSCGRGLPLLAQIKGRTTDFVVSSNGTAIHALALIYVVRDLPGIRSFKIVQESLTKTKVIVVCSGSFDADTRTQLINGIKSRLGQDVEIEIEVVESIPPERSGKHRHVVSHVPTDFVTHTELHSEIR